MPRCSARGRHASWPMARGVPDRLTSLSGFTAATLHRWCGVLTISVMWRAGRPSGTGRCGLTTVGRSPRRAWFCITLPAPARGRTCPTRTRPGFPALQRPRRGHTPPPTRCLGPEDRKRRYGGETGRTGTSAPQEVSREPTCDPASGSGHSAVAFPTKPPGDQDAQHHQE